MTSVKYHNVVDDSPETAVLVGLITPNQDERKTTEYLDELEFLAETAGAKTIRRFTHRLGGPNSVTYLGIGKLQEIRAYIQAEEDAERRAPAVEHHRNVHHHAAQAGADEKRQRDAPGRVHHH